jgi:hypothetical protein
MRRLQRAQHALVGASVCGALVAVAACVDTTAIAFEPQALTTPAPADAGLEEEDADLRRPCQRCVESPDEPGPGCGTETSACSADPQCAQIYACALREGCFEKASRHDAVSCGIPCAQEAGVVSTSDPVVSLILGVTECVSNGACGGICTGVEAGP